ncbi:peptidoglycan editing factor PgeF [Petroclostridium sp. X23]|uniref:peptidoglycan editing factor PgeF n=1 Tax=Petroclostridium sp. X23 TaxID=3045146 RepID=UPI0024AE21CE|nr:peptidoglycan editing factor PgeF [Petroclostridium sp. X23]WHH58999.1 peptidoglycan editing factor PgeF [Petroclostridium sp. X23]
MKTGFKHHMEDALEYLTIPSFDETGLVAHCFTTRKGGVSEGECKNLNLGYNRNDRKENVTENFRIIMNQLNINYNDLVFSNQVHKDEIANITATDKGKGMIKESDILEVDGLITNQKGVPLVTFYADCVPLFFLDPVKCVIALSHSGWRGTAKMIGAKTIMKMVKEYGCNTDNILTAIGPSIGKCHFEVDAPVIEQFHQNYGQDANKFVIKKDGNKYHIDLWQANIIQFNQAGIKDEHITLANECTFCDEELYFSHRRDKGKTGSLCAIMQLV